MRFRVAVVVVLVVVGLAAPRAQQAMPLRVLASNGVKAAFEALAQEAERRTGRPVVVTFATSAATRERIAQGQPFDVAILTNDVLDALAKEGAIVPSSRVRLGQSGIGVGVRAGRQKPDIRSEETLKRTLLAARSVTWASDGASRPHIMKMLESLGITDALAGKTVLEQGSVRATSRVARGDTELVITLVSEILPVEGIELVGPLPAEFQSYVSFGAAIGSRSASPDPARALTTFLAGPAAHKTFLAKGID